MIQEAFSLRRKAVIVTMDEFDKGAGQEKVMFSAWTKFTTCAILYGTMLLQTNAIDKARPVFADAIHAARVRIHYYNLGCSSDLR